ncbi:MAG: hypothetical protein ACP6IY_09425 [Promethearchaeia archaeon]
MKQKKFKIGDKVKIINPDEKSFNMIGEIVDMKIHNDMFDWVGVKFDKVDDYVFSYCLSEVEKIADEHTFEWAIEQMKLGKKVRKPIWNKDSYINLSKHHCHKILFKNEKQAFFFADQILSTDWEIYEEQKFPINFKNKYINFLVYEDGSILINNIITHSMINIYDSLPLLEQAIKKSKELKK